MSTRRRNAVILATLAAAAGLAGCSSQDSRLAAYRMNPTPELDTLSQRHDDIDNRLTVTNDTNFRQLNEDIGKALLLDRPSRLSIKGVPY